MSEMQAEPYQPKDYTAAPALAESGRMDYGRAIGYLFENPNWLMNILFTGLCMLIPVINTLVIHGYQFTIIESLHLRRHQTYPDFEFDNFVDYLLRGLWVFLVSFVLGLLLIPVILGIVMLAFAVIAAVGAAAGGEGAVLGMVVAIPVFITVGFAVLVLLQMFMVPFVLRAGLTQSFSRAFDFGFAKQFVGNTWLEMIISALFFIVVGIILEIIGVAMCGVGIILTMAAGCLIQAHIGYQLYEVHLAKGGAPIPLLPPKPHMPQKPVM